MIAQLFDRQDVANSMNGMRLNNSAELRKLLDHLRGRQPFFAELLGENGYKLLLGVGAPQACVQYSAIDGAVPYLMAVVKDASDAVGEVEFLIGDTATPIPKRYCLPYDTMVEIAARFVDTGERHSGVQWEEI